MQPSAPLLSAVPAAALGADVEPIDVDDVVHCAVEQVESGLQASDPGADVSIVSHSLSLSLSLYSLRRVCIDECGCHHSKLTYSTPCVVMVRSHSVRRTCEHQSSILLPK